MPKERLAAFTDGVITFMVLELKVPHGADCDELGAGTWKTKPK